MVEEGLIASALIEKEGKFFLVKAKVGTPKGLWNLPGGHLDEGETFSQAVVREAKEETGFDVSIGNVLCIVHQILTNYRVIVTFNSKIIGGSLSLPEEEIREAMWFSFEEAMKMDKNSITHSAYNSIIAFKKNAQMNYFTHKLTACYI